MQINTLPAARNNDLVVQELGKELLIYDLQTHKAYQLNETSMIVFNACASQTSFDELKQKYKFTDDLIHLTLDRLKDENLIGNYNSQFAGISRREAIKKVGLATMIALPVIVGITAPAAAHAASTAACAQATEACTFDNGTQAGCCNNLRCAGFNQCVACSPATTLVSCVLTAFCCSGTSTPIGPANIFCNCN